MTGQLLERIEIEVPIRRLDDLIPVALPIRTLKVLGTVATARNPLGSAAVAGELWVPCIDADEVDVVDPSTMHVVARRKVGSGPIVVLPAFGHRWVSSTTGNSIWRL